MNLNYLTKDMWNIIRNWEYETLMKASEMLQPVYDEGDE